MPEHIFYSTYFYSDFLPNEVTAAQEWLKRNREPFEDVLENWKICQKYRLKNLIANKKTSTQQYIERWLNILQQPQAYKLVCFFVNFLCNNYLEDISRIILFHDL